VKSRKHDSELAAAVEYYQGVEAAMVQKEVCCPACKRRFTRRGLHTHFRQALSGWDPIWDSAKPHVRWAQSKGITVTDEGYTFEYEKLNDALDRYISGE